MNPSKILIKTSDMDLMINDVMEHAEKGVETGFSFFGEIRPNNVYVITNVKLAGIGAVRSHASFTTDDKETASELERLMKENHKIRLLGEGHLHPWPTTPEPSSIDINQLRKARKERIWFIIAVFSSTGEARFFGLDSDDELLEIPFQVAPDGFEESDLLSRISEITDSVALAKVRVGVLGCGSLASAVIPGLAGSGITDYILCDMDKLETANLVRHIGGTAELGVSKVEIVSDYIQSHNPLACVRIVEDDLIKNRELLRAVIESCDIVVAASGNPELNYHINSICVELGKPAVYGGIYAGAKSAYVFCVPTKSHACFDCIFSLTGATYDQGALKRKYGLDNGELREAQGMFADISIPGSIMAKMTLNILLGKEFSYNLVRYYDTPKIELINVEKKKLCATCDYENWLQSEEEKHVMRKPTHAEKPENLMKVFLRRMRDVIRR